jgi:membrane fusion protein (multidrug efflux system)
MKVSPVLPGILALISLSLPACDVAQADESHPDHRQTLVTRSTAKDVVIPQQYVCRIRSQRHINVCALQNGYLQEIKVGEGQRVKKGDWMFKIVSTLSQANPDAEPAEATLAELELMNTEMSAREKVVAQNSGADLT